MSRDAQKILLVDEDPIRRKVLQDVVEGLGGEFIWDVSREPTDLAILGGMSLARAAEQAEHLREAGAHRVVVVIEPTGLDREPPAPIAGVLPWPAHVSLLRPLIRSHLEWARIDRQVSRPSVDGHIHLLEGCLERLNDIVMITEARPIQEPGPRIVFVNQAFVRLSGYSKQEALGRSPRFLRGPDTDRRALERIRVALLEGRPVREPILNYTKDGRELWVECEISPIFDDLGQITHFVSVQRDITESRRAERCIAEQAALLDKAQDAGTASLRCHRGSRPNAAQARRYRHRPTHR